MSSYKLNSNTTYNCVSATDSYLSDSQDAIVYLFIYFMQWSSEKVDTLIALYESHPHLYNVQLCDYHNKVKRVASLEDTALWSTVVNKRPRNKGAVKRDDTAGSFSVTAPNMKKVIATKKTTIPL